jgi:hypothetical protein
LRLNFKIRRDDRAGASLLRIRGIVEQRRQLVQARELALKELSTATNRLKWIAVDDVDGRSRRIYVAASGADLIQQRLVDARPRAVLGAWCCRSSALVLSMQTAATQYLRT